MDVKKAIRTLKEFDLTEDEQNEIIDLLKRGEKYEAMWREVKQFHNKKKYIDSLEYYEQKYFPELGKKEAIK